MAAVIMTIFFNNLLKEKNGLLLSFIISILVADIVRGLFTARNQIFSILVFELEIYSLIKLLEQGKKRYFWVLIALAFLLVLVHDTLYFLFFIFILPYLADYLLNKFFKIDNTTRFKNSNLKNGKYLIILIILAIPIGFCTPVFASTYTNLINCMNGISTSFINELKLPVIMEDPKILTVIFLAVGLIGFTKTKYKIKDVLFVFGLIIFALMANRNSEFLYMIGIIYLTNMLTECINSYVGEEKKELYFGLIEKSKYTIVLVCFTVIVFGAYSFSLKRLHNHVNDITYPVDATEWILENVDYENARIWTHFDWGSYLEFKGIKVFVDSRSGMYTEQENEGCTVLADWYDLIQDGSKYETLFEKYKITHVLMGKNELAYKYIEEDVNYKAIYEDNVFVLFERNEH